MDGSESKLVKWDCIYKNCEINRKEKSENVYVFARRTRAKQVVNVISRTTSLKDF